MLSEDEIKELCAQAIAADGADFNRAARKLHMALKAHIESLRAMAAAALLNPSGDPPNSPDA